jgi:hypothetical protein
VTEESHRDALRADRASKAGAARMRKLSKAERAALASKAAKVRWGKWVPREDTDENTALPVAKWSGTLSVGDWETAVYVFDDRRRVLGGSGAATILTGAPRGGNLEGDVHVRALEGYMPPTLQNRMIDFVILDVPAQTEKGVTAEAFLEICGAYVHAWRNGVIVNDADVAIAKRSAVFLAACSKVGLFALIDEATGFESRRAKDELQLTLRALLLEEMQKWERTFPRELWEQFARLTNWKGSLHQHPKYWGRLTMELIYDYLDLELVEWLRENAPASKHAQSYEQWLSSQYGLKKLIEHTWKVIGVASTCEDGRLAELQQKMKQIFGEKPGFEPALRLISAERNFTSR